MTPLGQTLLSDLRGYGRLAVDATLGVTDVVEGMHGTIARFPLIVGGPVEGRTRGITRLVYGSIRGTTRAVGLGVDAALSMRPAVTRLDAATPGRDRAIAILNGIVGDHLAASGNPLAIAMSLRHEGRRLEPGRDALARAIPSPRRRLLVMVHGLCMSDLGWRRRGHDHGARIAGEMGATALYLHYNSGLRIAGNGVAFAARLEELVESWPVPVEDITILGHSMGGLVARSACHAGEAARHAWRQRLRRLVFLGTPHHGAPLERGGNWLQAAAGVSPYTAPLGRLGRLRSAGITDLRHGSLLAGDVPGDRFADHADRRRAVPLPDGVACFAIAAARRAGACLGDVLVPVASALGRHADPRFALGLPRSRCFIARGTSHLGLLDAPGVHERLRRWLVPSAGRARAAASGRQLMADS